MLLGALFAALVLLYVYCMIQVPIAAIFGFAIQKGAMIPCIVGWGGVAFVTICALVSKIWDMIRPALDSRHEKKLSLLEQRIKDGKEGICTIVEVV